MPHFGRSRAYGLAGTESLPSSSDIVSVIEQPQCLQNARDSFQGAAREPAQAECGRAKNAVTAWDRGKHGTSMVGAAAAAPA